MTARQRITPSLWFDRQAEESARLYTSIFKESRIGNIVRAGSEGREVHGLPAGTPMTVEFEVWGHRFIAINGGPIFKFTPAVSFLVACDTREQVDALWDRLAQGGMALMELGRYPFSERYGWVQDRYGLSWQVMFMGDRPVSQRITPTLMFVGELCGKAEEAIRFYTALFRRASVGDTVRYGAGEGRDKEGTIKHASFTIEGQEFAAMDSALEHLFSFNEAISFLIECETQGEIDYYWEGLIAGGGQEGVCGWLKDRFGVSWQVVPGVLDSMLLDPDPEKVSRVTRAFMSMKKFDIGVLEEAYKGKSGQSKAAEEKKR